MVRPSLKRHNRTWGCAAENQASLLDLQKRSSLVVVTGGFFEITLNLPRTEKFNSMLSSRQKDAYAFIWDYIKNVVNINSRNHYVYEFCKSGHVHLHGYILLDDSVKHIPIGAISDIVKMFVKVYNRVFSSMNKRNILKYSDRSMWYMENCYKMPSICIHYRDKHDNERFQEWSNYMQKNALLNP